jgi:prepilin-type N-terminal cleavage/methylation domain-containing protein
MEPLAVNERTNMQGRNGGGWGPRNQGQLGMALVEVMMALAIAGLMIGSILSGYLFSITAAEKAAMSLAANHRAVERIEETRSVKWDTSSYPPVDELVSSNFPVKVVVLDLPGAGPNLTYATNITRITQLSVMPPLKQIHVDCIWRFRGVQLITNSIDTCRSPDQ